MTRLFAALERLLERTVDFAVTVGGLTLAVLGSVLWVGALLQHSFALAMVDAFVFTLACTAFMAESGREIQRNAVARGRYQHLVATFMKYNGGTPLDAQTVELMCQLWGSLPKDGEVAQVQFHQGAPPSMFGASQRPRETQA